MSSYVTLSFFLVNLSLILQYKILIIKFVIQYKFITLTIER